MRKILLALDGSPLGDRATGWAIAVARACGAELLVGRVFEPRVNGARSPLVWAQDRAQGERHLRDAVLHARRQGVRCTSCAIEGDAADGVLSLAHVHEVDLIVIATHGRGRRIRCPLGATAERIVELAECSVLVVPVQGSTDVALRSIVVLLDGSKRSEVVLPISRMMMAERVLLVRVVAEPEIGRTHAPSMDSELAARLTAHNCAAAKAYLRSVAGTLSRSAAVMVQSAPSVVPALRNMVERERPNLVILAARGVSGDRRYGGVASQLVRAPVVPTLVVATDRSTLRRHGSDRPLRSSTVFAGR